MPTFQIVEARPRHCGQMARALRREHAIAILRVGADIHRELRSCFDQSVFRRAWLIDGRLAAIGGVIGTRLSPCGQIWLAMTDETRRYPKAVVREAQRQLDAVMGSKRELYTTIIAGDDAARRLAVFLGFHVNHGEGASAGTLQGRRRLSRYLETEPDIRQPIGGSYAIALGYHAENAH